jgi:HK97 family phage prohead protease
VPTTDVRTSPIREDLCRSAPFTLTRATDEGSDGLTIEGYGAVFNSPTRINSWEGDFEEVVAPGAFKRSLRARVPRMQFDHGQHPLLGSLPLGRWTVAEEDERGLHLVGRLTDNWLVTPFRDAIRDGGVEGMSFRFAVVNDEWRDAQGAKLRDDEVAEFLYRGSGDRGPIRRTLREVKVSEAGPVVWPAYDDTAVGVRSRFGVTDLRDQRVTIDLGRLHQPGTQRRLADLVAFADRLTGARSVEDPADDVPQPVEATPPASVPAGSPNVEQQVEIAPPPSDPQSTAPSPDDHSTRRVDPGVTDSAPGEHSANASRPVNPTERRELIRREYRDRLKHLLALTQSSTDKKESA